MDGICTLANDRVYDQLIALLNSIEAIYGRPMPVCVYPYDDNTTQIAAEIARRPHVQLYDNQDSIRQWDDFVRRVWDTHPTAQANWQKVNGDKYYRVGTHRRYCAFDGPFDKFVYMDADTLLMSPLDEIFARLDKYDWVVYDFQYKDLSHVYDLSSLKLAEIFTNAELETKAFCSGFYGSKKGVFNSQNQEMILDKLRQGEAEILYPMAPDQTVLNYMVMRSGISHCNLSYELAEEQKTGCCVTSTHFISQDNILYDQGKRLTYLHYIGVKSRFFEQLCAGNNVGFPYREEFLHYRYLHEPNQRPQFTTKPKAYNAPPSLGTKILRKLGLKN
ncbi:Npun_R2821/Npun_R2822 family protein [Nostoc sp. CMAA1605]|uniref:Npun_R2821/Npun_R2822 family protein n=1 Tax=Nostoc sp. CMAA1605 TaxID=2055159 RepID=UPI001F426B6D|nr:Npun_R2821/Npun_R2822 family protein [Nostoc sp. CMAA1605]MCF4969846.1 sugar transferase [Nostoc sp. CMAA1605]